MVNFVVFLSFCCWKECHRRGALEFSILQGFGVLCSFGSSILPAVLVGCLNCSLRLSVGEVQVKKKTSRQKVRDKASKKQEGKNARNKVYNRNNFACIIVHSRSWHLCFVCRRESSCLLACLLVGRQTKCR
jgi:hypothetical protein